MIFPMVPKPAHPANQSRNVKIPGILAAGSPDGITGGAFSQSNLAALVGSPVVLIIEQSSEQRAIIAALLRFENYQLWEAASSETALGSIGNIRPDLIILNRRLDGIDGMECCRRLKASRNTELTPILMFNSEPCVLDEIAGMQAGADEYLRTPFHPELFLTRVRSLIRNKAAVDRLEESETILFALAQAVEKRDHSTAGHCHRLAALSVAFGIRLSLPNDDLLALHRGGYLHDIGKIAIPDSILFKPGKLTPEEWVLMKTHSVRGEEICRPLRSLRQVLPIIRNHHERWDGTGYPDGLRRQKIPLLARVLQLADAYDALTSERPYKPAYSSEVAMETLLEESLLGWRDPELTRIFLSLPLQDLNAAAQECSELEEVEGFEVSIRNLKAHLFAIAS